METINSSKKTHSLFDLSVDKLTNDILLKKVSLKTLKTLPEKIENIVLEKLKFVDQYRWQRQILESIIRITIDKSKTTTAEWQKDYDEYGMRDFHEVFYFVNETPENVDEYNEISKFNNEFYDVYQKVFYECFPDPYLEEDKDWMCEEY